MSKEIEIKIEPNDPQFDENDEDSNSNMEQPASTSNTDHINNFVGIKQEPVIQIKLEPLEDEYQDDSGDMDTENVLMKFEHSLYESNEAIKLPRAKNVNYKEEDSDEEYVPRMKTAKKTHKKLSTFDPNVKRGFKGRSKTKSKDDPTYSEDIMDKIDIVTIDEATRQEEHQDALRTRKHMNYTCDYCALGFVVEEAYQMHLKIHSEEAGDHECDICKVRLKTSEMQYQHRLRHYRRYRCSICHLQQRDKDTVAAHIMRQHMGIAFVCKHCGRDFKRPQYLNRHIKQMHTKPLYLECPVCSRVFHERGWFRCHVRTHNEQVQKNITRKVQCSHCGREFRNKQYLVRHLAVHEDRRPKTCDMCSRSFKNSEVLRVHKRQHHGQNPASSEKLAYSLEEKKLLVQLVRDRPIIEDKEINYKTIEQKTNAWQELSEAFNAASSTSRRSAVQLRRCWKKMKWMRRKHLRDRILKGLPEGSSSDSESYVDEAIPLVDLQFPDIDNSNTVRKNKKKAERSVSKINITEKLEITIELGKKYDVNMALPEQSEANLDRNKQREENFDIIEPRGVKLEPTEQPEINADRSVISEADKKATEH
ncbi:zinc finger protein 493-like isoform X2 [Pararge aegeria]|uniref:Regulatory protein zeste n=2 Tax=Pararge aegeria TaxID=116150 RepID=A0A8S4SAF9_9NEOP|nr:zinc finger protein 493-like isoform X2 [Pararge aegeria]CAH2244920.1 jg21764 [Pararge aegeria aegeria]